jgi:hypothetical protein
VRRDVCAGRGCLARREKFWKAVPPKDKAVGALWTDEAAVREADADAPPVPLVALNHAALGVADLDNMTRSGTTPALCAAMGVKAARRCLVVPCVRLATAPQQPLPLPWPGAGPVRRSQSHRCLLLGQTRSAGTSLVRACFRHVCAVPGAAPVRDSEGVLMLLSHFSASHELPCV